MTSVYRRELISSLYNMSMDYVEKIISGDDINNKELIILSYISQLPRLSGASGNSNDIKRANKLASALCKHIKCITETDTPNEKDLATLPYAIESLCNIIGV